MLCIHVVVVFNNQKSEIMSFDERKEWKSNGILSLIRSGFTLCFLIMSMWICVCEYKFPQRL